MTYILNLETSSEVCSVCLSHGGEVVNLIETKEAFSHTRKMTLFISDCMKEAGIELGALDAVAISDGPGSYTGLRVSAATAKGLCFGLGIPLIAINTLHALAYHTKTIIDAPYYIPMIDARRMEVYTSIYSNTLQEVGETHSLILDQSAFEGYQGKGAVLCGTGVEKCTALFDAETFDFRPLDLSSAYLVGLSEAKFAAGKFENIASYSPNYFKAPKVTRSKKPLF